ncbi:MAG: D-2-hydroxyacid dehydrogenase family protein [Chloroflexi bacterium]|nr:D-2-hydroxyacid dehydrogenase family protein [Chloroflexota bacterium]MDA1226448.1 D-2-hydroxyacid dehydrogenase family protein [Chloroflexota bacterium]
MSKLALLDDYQSVAMESADWSTLPDGCTVEAFHDHLFDESAVAERLKDFDFVMALRERTPFPKTLLERLPNLKMLGTAGARNASIDMQAATDLGIAVCGTGGSPRATMELTWGLILGLLRKIPQEYAATKAGVWQQTLGEGLEGRTLGLLGLGRIGGQAAEVARAFHMNIIAWSQNLTGERAQECGATLVSKEELFSRADVVSIHLQLSDRTRGLVQAEDLARMKPTAYLVNTSRGPIVDEAALIDALKRKVIAGAGVDVFEVEPMPSDHPLLGLDNALITPHMGYVTEETYKLFYGDTLDNVRGFMNGDPQRVVNSEVLGKIRTL